MKLALPPPTAERLVRIAGMLGSAHDGERANAAAAGTRLLQQHGMTWRDLILPGPAERPQARQGGDHQARARRVLADAAGRLTAWESGFLSVLSRQLRSPSVKQEQVLARLEERCR